ncbi:NACHT, LRR and PYD domains-containing protein 1a isoform X2 [Esox lucius]|nr:NACHT, LRR and PYD domains-containing protein 1a isoform X2 [Esox lucius]XP_034146526.1 NACHT, LRR and PYD domains-containing protein 1a isoform X2 [Esox lucius]XP_034146527.1 NACHT, LRR and PYD domains-containing protein 1a isoform X2 [Esox lucius]
MECLTCSHLKTAENWIELEPFVSSEDEISIYRLESTAGCYECKVSGLRWVCKKKVTLQYHFRPWDPHRGLLQSMGYRQGGPLLDIKIIAGKLEEVHLPHFACFGVEDHYNPTIEQSVRVLSVEDNNVSIGKVDKVTRFHVKIVHPSFSLRGVILQALGFSVHSDLLIYQDKTAHLTLRTYLIPYDPALKEAVEKQEKCRGSTRILKPRPEKSLWLTTDYVLKTTCPSDIEKSVNPKRIELAHINPPNFYEVFIKDADFDFRLNLCCKGRKQLKWSQEIREAEYRRPPPDSPDQQSPAGGSRLGRSPE